MVLEVQLRRDLWLWCWEIREASGGELIESSWTASWTAYVTYEEAAAVGRRRMADFRPHGERHGSGTAFAA